MRVIPCADRQAFAVLCEVGFALRFALPHKNADLLGGTSSQGFGIILGYVARQVQRSKAEISTMAQSSPIASPSPKADPRAVQILAKNIYREFRASGFSERDVLALAGELLGLVTSDVKNEQAR